MLFIGPKHATAPRVPRSSILYVLTLSEANPSFDTSAEGRHHLDKHARKHEGPNLPTYFLTYSKFPSISAYLHKFHTSSYLVFEISLLQFQLPYKVVPQFFGRK